MSSKGISATVLFAFAVLLVGSFGCSSDDVTSPPAGGGGTSGVVVSAASPANGNGTLTASATFTQNANNTGYDEANISQSLGGVGHDLTVTWDTTTHAINAVNEGWFDGTTGGNTLCLAGTNPCDPTKVTVDFANHKVTFTGLVLPDAFGGTTTSTLTGTMVW
jgi:hypothetical protein